MFFAVEERVNPDIFRTMIGPIYPSIKIDRGSMTGMDGKVLGGRTIEQICNELRVEADSFAGHLADWPLLATV